MRKPLSSLLAELSDFKLIGSGATSVTGVTCDSRQVVPGEIFVAIPGVWEDGGQYVGEALDRGASVIVSHSGDIPFGRRPVLQVSNARQALSQLAAAWYDHPSRSLGITGITGTNGKTSVSFLLRHILQRRGVSCGLIGTVRYEVGDRHIPAVRTTPDAVELQKLLRRMVDEGCEKVVVEVSSHALQQDRVADVVFELAAFTNLTRDHLDYHGDMESYYRAKRRLFTLLALSSGRKAAILNTDDAYGRRLHAEIGDLPAVTYGMRSAADFSASNIEGTTGGTQFDLLGCGTSQRIRVPLVGVHNVQNCLAAVSLATEVGCSLPCIAEALETVPSIPGRLEPVALGQPFAVFIDYAHTADALERVLGTLKALSPNRLLLLFGCGGGRDAGKRGEMGKVAARLSDLAWITNDNPRYEEPEQIVEQIAVGMRVGGGLWEVEYDRRRAIDKVITEASAGDIVLIAGKGHEAYQETDGSVIPFEDRLYAEESLRNLGYDSGEIRLAL